MSEILGAEEVEQLIGSLSDRVVSDFGQDFSMVGIVTGGAHLAQKMSEFIQVKYGFQPQLGSIDITLYRDDTPMGLSDPLVGPTELPEDLADKTVVLVDDVLYTGRTTRAALDALMDFGRPRAVRLVVLVDRGHRELPVQADFVGLNVQTQADESVRVWLSETDARDEVVLRSGRQP